MTGSWLLCALLSTFLVMACAAFATRWLGAWTGRVVTAAHLVAITLALLVALALVRAVLQGQSVALFGGWLFADALGSIFIGLVAVVGFLTGIYSISYLRHDVAQGNVSVRGFSTYYGFFHLFLFTMILAVTANNLVMMWVSIEATTLGSVFLVGFYRRKSSLEAAWKYVVICTVGVAFGLYGTVLVFSNANAVLANAGSAILWTDVIKHAAALDPATISIAFVFVLIGFGTKAGLFPMHAWMPDAYSEAPSPVSALLSGGLSNCALLVIVRYAVITSRAVGPHFPQILFLVFGVLSIGIAAFLIIMQRDVKRLLAYSSVENMGLIVLGLGVGGPFGVAAALLHTINHSLAKTLMFCGSGNILMKYGTRDLDQVKGMLRVAPASGFLLMVGALALGGMPPFNIFISEFLTLTAGVRAGYWALMVICMVLLTVVLAAFVRFVGGSILGPASDRMPVGDVGVLTLAPLGLTVALMLLMGVHVPRPVVQLIDQAAETVLGEPAGGAGALLSKPWMAANPATRPSATSSLASPCIPASPAKETTCRK